MSGWLKLHRKIDQWEWYADTNVFRVFMHLLIKANHKDGRFMGQPVPKGSVVTGREALSKETSLSINQIRHTLAKLKSTNEITIKTTNKFSIITITNYENYQSDNQQNHQQTTSKITNEQPTSNHNLRIKEVKKKEYNNITAPEDLTAEAWADFQAHRKAKKAPVTETALKGIRAEAAKAEISFQQAIEIMLARGWTGFKAEWITTGGNTHANAQSGTEPRGHVAMANINKAARRVVEAEKLSGKVRSAAEIFNIDREQLLEAPPEPAAQLTHSSHPG